MLHFSLPRRKWAEKALIDLAGPSSVKIERDREISIFEDDTQPLEMQPYQRAVDKAGADKSLAEAEDDIDPDSSGVIIHKPKGKDEEDGGQKSSGSSQNCRGRNP